MSRVAGGSLDAVVFPVTASDLHHVPAMRLANCNSRVRADCDTELFLSKLPESVADALDSKTVTRPRVEASARSLRVKRSIARADVAISSTAMTHARILLCDPPRWLRDIRTVRSASRYDCRRFK